MTAVIAAPCSGDIPSVSVPAAPAFEPCLMTSFFPRLISFFNSFLSGIRKGITGGITRGLIKAFAKSYLIRGLTLTILISLLLVVAGSLYTTHISRSFQSSVTANFELQRLSGKITHLDEVRTMSARMAAATGDEGWEARYKAYEPVLIKALNQAIALAPETYATDAKQVDAANLKLVEMEAIAFERIREKKPDRALAILFSDDYTLQKERYAAGMQRWSQSLSDNVERDLQAYDRGIFWSGVFSMTSFWLLVLAWGVILYQLNQYIERREHTEKTLRRKAGQLEVAQHELALATTALEQNRTALTSAQTSLENSRDRLQKNDATFRLGQLVSEATNAKSSMATLNIDALQTFASNDSKTPQPVDIHACLDNTLQLLQPRLAATPEQSAIAIIRDYNPLPSIEGYPAALNQAFLHLLTNAIEALSQSRQVTQIQSKSPGPSQITLRTRSFIDAFDNEWIELTIIDTGEGIPEPLQDRIFTPFFTTKSAVGNIGLGLSNSYSLITQTHNGRLSVSTTPGHGTTVTVQLPVIFEVAK